MKKLALAVALLALFAATAVSAGGPPVFELMVPTGHVDEWGEQINEAIIWIDPSAPFEYSQVVNLTSDSTYPYICNVEEDLCNDLCRRQAPSVINGYLASGLNETRGQITVNAYMMSYLPIWGDVWGERRFTITDRDGLLLRSTIIHSGDTYSTTLAANPIGIDDIRTEGYRWQLEVVPEPQSITSILGLMGFGGLAMRRRK